jgi:hypothetical protein
MHYFSHLFDKVLYMFRTGPLSIIRSISTLYTRKASSVCVCWKMPTELAWQIPIACIQFWDTPDGQWTCPKHVEYVINWIWEIVHLIGFYWKNMTLYSLVGLYISSCSSM